MKYFIDTEFIEGPQKTLFGFTKPTIDLISIGIKAEDGREYYTISKDFNLKEAWDRFDWKEHISTHKEDEGKILHQKVYWLRENVLRPIFNEYYIEVFGCTMPTFSYSSMKKLVDTVGKSNKQIAEEVKFFCLYPNISSTPAPEFYAYYGDYDWVVFCWLFGKMINLPNKFPKYCRDLQQTFDEKKSSIKGRMKDQPGYPVNNGIHNALEDARWNFKLYNFLNTL